MADVQHQQDGAAGADPNAPNNNNNDNNKGGMMGKVLRMLTMYMIFNGVVGSIFGSNSDNAAAKEGGGGGGDAGRDQPQITAGGSSNSNANGGQKPPPNPVDGMMAMLGAGPAVNNFARRVKNIAPFMVENDLMSFTIEFVETYATVPLSRGGDAADGGALYSSTASAGDVPPPSYPVFSSAEALPTLPPADHSDFLNRLIKPYFSGAVYNDEDASRKLLAKRERRLAREAAMQGSKTLSIEEGERVNKGAVIDDEEEEEGPISLQNADNFFPFSLDTPIRNLTKSLNLTSCYARNCTLVARVNVFYQHPTPLGDNANDADAPSFASRFASANSIRAPRRLMALDFPLITFVEKIDTELVTLLGGDDGEEEEEDSAAAAALLPATGVAAADGPSDVLVVAGSNIDAEKKPKKKTTKKKKAAVVRSRTKRKRNTIDSTIDGVLDWAKKNVFGGAADENVAAAVAADVKKQSTAADVKKQSTAAVSSNNADDDEEALLPSSSAAAAAAAALAIAREQEEPTAAKTRYQMLFQPIVTLSPVVDFTRYAVANIPPPISPNYRPVVGPPPTASERARALLLDYDNPQLSSHARLQMEMSAMQQKSLQATELYAPIIYVNNFWVLEDHLVALNSTNADAVEFTLSIEPLSLMRFMLYNQFDDAMKRNEEWGTMTRYDRDMTKKIFLESNVLLLIVTMFVSTLHSVFEFLALKNDVSFWRNRKSFKGLSLRTIAVNLYFQLIIFLYLLDSEETSYMILIPAGISIFVEGWKLMKTMKLERNPTTGRLGFKFSASYDEKTRTYDQQAMRYLTYLLVPCLIGYSIYSAMYHDHKGWYSFLISCQVKFIYFSGFIMMTPQIFINYKLKSVTAVPWRTFVYRFLNTIVDDLFAFVITMPTLHRIACFRDDVVFLILLFQRWKYPVDERRTEDGYKDDEEEEEDENAEEGDADTKKKVEGAEEKKAIADAEKSEDSEEKAAEAKPAAEAPATTTTTAPVASAEESGLTRRKVPAASVADTD